ncbi:Non-ribosomal peptide synthetase (fragment) [Paraburkholderia ribeironis]|uniref:Non-ribosomal peptide synthetase n=1 Tax=Paraburkholderia ribeironis TaxID=1247936 RepID=A0A1N7RUR3_9BURK
MNAQIQLRDTPQATLSPAQGRMWFLQCLAPHSPFYNIPAALRLVGVLDLAALGRALNEVIATQEALRTSFAAIDGRPVPKVERHLNVELPVIDLTGQPVADREAQLSQRLHAEAHRIFDMSQAPLLRAQLLRLGARNHVLQLTTHHLVVDGWSVGILIRQLFAAYRHHSSNRPGAALPVAAPYSSFARAQQQWLADNKTVDSQIDYWRQTLNGAPSVLRLPLDRARPRVPRFAGRTLTFLLPETLSQRVTHLAQGAGVTLFVTLLAAFKLLLARLSGQSELVVATAASNRNRPDFEAVIGCFANTLALRTRIDATAAFVDLMAAVQHTVTTALDHQDLPFEHVLRALKLHHDQTSVPFVQAMFLFEPASPQRWDLPRLTASTVDLFCDTARFDLGLYMVETEKGLKGILEYSSDLFDAATIDRFIDRFQRTLEDVVARPDVPLRHLTWELSRIVATPAEQEAPLSSLPALVLAQAARTPDAPALAWEGGSCSYRQLAARVRGMAAGLEKCGIGPGDRVALVLRRSPSMVAALLAIMLTGAAYVPLDWRAPKERQRQLAEAAGARMVLTDQHPVLTSAAAVTPTGTLMSPDLCGSPDDAGGLAYVIYTSGSTGEPNGVMVSHASVVNLAWALKERVYGGLGSGPLRVGLNGPLSFDTSVKQLVQLAFGHCLVLLPESQQGFDPAALRNALEVERVDVFDSTPSQMAALLAAGVGRSATGWPRRVLLGGEAVPIALWRALADCPTLSAVNLYGPTECTVDATAAAVTGEEPHIGTPLPGVTIVLLDDHLQPVADGMVGEIGISGRGVAQGYLGAPRLTAERFIPDLWSGAPGARLYRTGDLGRWRPDGTIEYLGRRDMQFKRQGVRIEPAEIEQMLCRLDGVAAALVWEPQEQGGVRQLVAAVVPTREHAAVVDGVRRQALPNGLAVAGLNRNETEFLYEEIFVTNAYFRHGIHIADGAQVLDVGANIGLFGLASCAMATGVRVHCVEPNPFVLPLLKTNIALYAPNARIWPVAAGEREGTQPFTFYPHLSFLSGLHGEPEREKALVRSYLEHHQADDLQAMLAGGATALDSLLDHELAAHQFSVPVQTLSQIFAEAGLDRIDLLKINVEKSEENVLAGIIAEHWQRIRQVVMEVHDEEGRLERILSLLQANGFQVSAEADWSVAGREGIHYLYARRPDVAPAASASPMPPREMHTRRVLTAREVLEHAAATLPAAFVPNRIMLVDHLPITANGKLDRAASVPEAPWDDSAQRPFVPCADGLESRIAQLWQQVLPGRPKVGRFDSFFDLGGNSLLLAHVHSRLHEIVAHDVTLTEMFEFGTPSALAGRLGDAMRIAGPTVQSTTPDQASCPRALGAIAIVGMAGRFPGADSVTALWQNLCQGNTAISRFSSAELYAAGVPESSLADSEYVPTGGVLTDIGQFDTGFFGIAPSDAAILDPQQRLFMTTVWQALEDAGCAALRRIGLFAGTSVSTYLLNNIWRDPALLEQFGAHRLLVANDKDHFVTQTSYRLGFSGPSVAVQTACSSSLVAVHLACRSLLAGECDAAVAGGASIRVPQRAGYRFQEGGIGSRDGRCAPFDASASGTVGGNGVAAVVLKRLADAQAAGDRIIAVISGSAINNDGDSKIGYTAPSVEGQSEVIGMAMAAAGVDADSISYVEAHGTGTALGDPIEIAALARAFSLRPGDGSAAGCSIGSIKATIGHLDVAAGVAGLVKAALMVQHGLLVPSANFATPSPAIDFAKTPFRVVTDTRPWTTPAGKPRRAGVSSFGIGGTNAHVLLEQAETTDTPPSPIQDELLVWSAHDASALDILTCRLADALDTGPRLADFAYSLQTGRRAFAHRCTLIARDATSAAAAMRQGRFESAVATSPPPPAEPAGSLQIGEDAQARRRALQALAAHWRAGGKIDWQALYAARTARRIPLPLYPLAGGHYWIGSDEAAAAPCPAPALTVPTPADDDPVVAKLTAIWCQALGVPTIGTHDDFFDLGGHSLMALDILDAIRAHWPLELPLRAVFEATTIDRLARLIREAQADPTPSAGIAQ